MFSFLKLRNLSWRGAMAVVLLTGASTSLIKASPRDHYGRGVEYGDLHNLVGRTQEDLRMAEQGERDKGRTRVRYDHAQHHLSTFDRHLAKGRFDKDTLNSAIGNVQSVLDHNTLMANARESLMLDVSALREARSRRF